VERRYGDKAVIVYVDVTTAEAQRDHADAIAEIKDRELIYPVTFVDGKALYDGAVSYPAILRAIETSLEARAQQV
jgi:disulfide oxidoreductase YuzD